MTNISRLCAGTLASCRVLLAGVALLLVACDDSGETNSTGRTLSSTSGSGARFEQEQLSNAAVDALVGHYLEQVTQDLQQSIGSAEALDAAIKRFLNTLDEADLDEARRLWLAAITDYEATAVHRYFFQQVMNNSNSGLDLGLALDRLHFQIDYWPILPGYIDYLKDYPGSGVVGDMTVPLNHDSILQQHGVYDLSEALLGFHPLEFLLWGENLPPGEHPRPVSDYQPVTDLSAEQQEEGLQVAQLDNNRRRQLLELVSTHLVDDLRAMQQLWSRNENTFNIIMDAAGSTGQIRILLDAASAMVSEEILVRSLYPMLNGDFDNSQQSPYSHSTENAVIAQLGGVEKLLSTVGIDDITMETMLSALMSDFSENFYLNLDASKECLALLYASAQQSANPRQSVQTEFEIVECINLVANMTNTLDRVIQQIP